MNELWRQIDSNYWISNYGVVYSKRSKKELNVFFINNSGHRQIAHVSINGVTKSLPRLILKYFKREELNKNKLAWNIDMNPENNMAYNLEGITRGDLMRYYNSMNKKNRGVYNYQQKLKSGKVVKKFRAVMKINDKAVTIGYSDTFEDAEVMYKQAFQLQYGYKPY